MRRNSIINGTTKPKRIRNGARGRRSPSNITRWEKKFRKKLNRFHKQFAKKTFHRLMKKSSTLRSTLKRRSKEYEVEFNISLEEVRELLYRVYGHTCNYCNQKLLVNNMACDHILPLSLGGGSTPENLQMICGRCNTRKGPLTHKNFRRLLNWLNHQDKDLSKYVLRKLSSRGF